MTTIRYNLSVVLNSSIHGQTRHKLRRAGGIHSDNVD